MTNTKRFVQSLIDPLFGSDALQRAFVCVPVRVCWISVMRDRAKKPVGIVTACAFCLLTGACNSVTVRETALSTRQRVAMVSSPGDGISPPTNVVLFEERPGRYTPIAAGFAQAPVTSFLQGAGAGIALGIGARGVKTKVSVSESVVDD